MGFCIQTCTNADAIECSSSVEGDMATVSCPDLDGQPDNGDLLCSVDSGTPENCEYMQLFTHACACTAGSSTIIVGQFVFCLWVCLSGAFWPV